MGTSQEFRVFKMLALFSQLLSLAKDHFLESNKKIKTNKTNKTNKIKLPPSDYSLVLRKGKNIKTIEGEKKSYENESHS
jgi:hypothetical protein